MKIEIDGRTPSIIATQLIHIADQCAKEQYFNALHVVNELQGELLRRLQYAINREQSAQQERNR